MFTGLYGGFKGVLNCTLYGRRHRRSVDHGSYRAVPAGSIIGLNIYLVSPFWTIYFGLEACRLPNSTEGLAKLP